MELHGTRYWFPAKESGKIARVRGRRAERQHGDCATPALRFVIELLQLSLMLWRGRAPAMWLS